MEWIFLACHTVFMVWAVFFGGAVRLETTFTSYLIVDSLAPFLSARLLSAYIFFSWLAHLAVVLLRGSV